MDSCKRRGITVDMKKIITMAVDVQKDGYTFEIMFHD